MKKLSGHSGRIQLRREKELSSGNCSLSLKANTSHSGRYRGRVVIDGKRHDCLVNLKVLPKGKDPSQNLQDVTESPDNPNSGTDGQNNIIGVVGVVGGVLVLVALIIIITLAYCYREQLKHLCRRRNANNPQTHPSVSYHQAQQQPQDEENEPVDQNQNEERSQVIENEDQDDSADGNEPTADN